MDDTALRSSAWEPLPRTHSIVNPKPDEKFGRTVVIGGFSQDTPMSEIKQFINEKVIKEELPEVDEIYAYSYGSVCFVRFHTNTAMWQFLTEYGKRVKPKRDDKEIWATVSRTPEERKKEREDTE